ARRVRRVARRRPPAGLRLALSRRARARRLARAAARAAGSHHSPTEGGSSVRPVVELTPRLEEIETREFDPGQRERYERHLGEILSALGMDLHTPGTRDTPRRLLLALIAATAGYDGDEKLLTAFPSERPAGVDGSHGQIVEGPIAFHALCEHHALPFHGVAHVA